MATDDLAAHAVTVDVVVECSLSIVLEQGSKTRNVLQDSFKVVVYILVVSLDIEWVTLTSSTHADADIVFASQLVGSDSKWYFPLGSTL
jgi:hypothetical protein